MSAETKRVEFKTRPDLVIFVRALSMLDSIEHQAKLAKAETTKDIMAEQLVAYVCDEHGKPMFADAAAAIEWMSTHRAGVGYKLVKEAVAFNDLGDESIEEERKN